jgi:hypothetical protein
LSSVSIIHPHDGCAEWLPDGNVVAHPYPPNSVRLASDASGGVYVAWAGGYAGSLRLSRISADGRMAADWPDGSQPGIGLFPYPWWGYPQSVIEDGHGGAFVIEEASDCAHTCGGDYHYVLATRIQANAVRAPGWPADGVRLGIGGNNKSRPQIDADADAQGGVVAAWSVAPIAYGPTVPREVRAQRIDGSGRLLWGDDGVVVQPVSPVYNLAVTIVADGRGGAFVFWLGAASTRILGQHLSADGKTQWADGGEVVVDASGSVIGAYRAIADRSGGATLAWIAGSPSGGTLSLTRVRGDRASASQTEIIARSLPADAELSMAADRSGGGLLAWSEGLGDTNRAILAQRFNHGGQPMWRGRGVMVSSARSQKRALNIVSDGSGGAYLAWGDSRAEGELYAMRLDRWGESADGWRRDGSPLCQPMKGLLAVELVADGNRAAFVAWTDERQYPGDSYPYQIASLMRLTPTGPAASPPANGAPTITRGAEVALVARPAVELAVNAVEPSPSQGVGVVRFSLAHESPALLELFDLGGRRLWSEEVGSMGPGEHSIRVGGTAWVPSGVYFVRLTQGDRAASARVAIVR